MQQQFTSSELSLLIPLLELFPEYCPYEVMFASFYNGTITNETVELCRQQLRPLRNVLSHTDEVTPALQAVIRGDELLFQHPLNGLF
jgi:hypothetical protein